MAETSCHYCTRPADSECHTCGRLYCAEHGDEVCLRCLSPEAATPSVLLYRGAILALAVASLLTVFLLVRPPESKSNQDSVRTLATPTPLRATTATPTPPGQPTPTRPAVSTPAPATASATNGASGTQAYKVQPGDSLSSIARDHNITVEELRRLNPGISETLQIDQEVRVPTR